MHYLNWIWFVNAAGYFWRSRVVWLRLLRGTKLKTPGFAMSLTAALPSRPRHRWILNTVPLLSTRFRLKSNFSYLKWGILYSWCLWRDTTHISISFFIHRQASGSAWPCSCRVPSVLLRLAVTMAFVATTQRSLNQSELLTPTKKAASLSNFTLKHFAHFK